MVLSKIGLAKNLKMVVDGESLLNDGVAVSGAGAIFIREVLGGGVQHHRPAGDPRSDAAGERGAVASMYAARPGAARLRSDRHRRCRPAQRQPDRAACYWRIPV
jgi:hypothetical protein